MSSGSASNQAVRTETVAESYAHYRVELRAYFAAGVSAATSVEDLVQQVYERLLRYRPREPVGDPRSYLFGVARNVLLAANRRARIDGQRYVVCEASELDALAHGHRALWVQEDGGPEVADAEFVDVLMRLPVTCQAVFLRHRRDGWSYQRIADELGISKHTVKDYVVQALNHFRMYFEQP